MLNQTESNGQPNTKQNINIELTRNILYGKQSIQTDYMKKGGVEINTRPRFPAGCQPINLIIKLPGDSVSTYSSAE